MSNIYLRLPSFVCAYIRNQFPDHHLSREEPLVLPAYTEEGYLLRAHLDIDSNVVYKCGEVPASFSQTEWHNMTEGRRPEGGKVVTKRNRALYLSYDEISELCQMPVSKKTQNFDYLCIEMPNKVFFGDRYRKTNNSWKLTVRGISELTKCFVNTFRFAMLQFERASKHYCANPMGDGSIYIDRKDNDMWERFFYCYEIPMPDGVERESFKKLCQRLHEYSDRAAAKHVMEYVTYEDPKDKVVHVDVKNVN